MLHDTSAQVPPPDLVQVIWKWTADPRQREGVNRSSLTGQALDADAYDRERGVWCGAGMQVGPGVHRHLAIHRMRCRCRAIWSAVRLRVAQAQAGPMQSRTTATGIQSWGTEEHAVDGQADQAVGLQLGLGELASLVAAVQSHHGTGCLR